MRRTVNRERKLVGKEQTSVDFKYNTLEQVLERVKELIKDYGKDATIRCYCAEYSDSDKEYMYVYKDEPETDSEMAIRIADEEKWVKEAEKRDAAEFERLQLKFGSK